MDNIKYILYLTVNTKNRKIYVGVHKTDPTKFDGYVGDGLNKFNPSSLLNPKTNFHYAVKKYGFDAFERYTIAVLDTEEEALNLEGLIVNKPFVEREDTYNMVVGGGNINKEEIPIYQFDLEGNLIQKYPSLITAAEALGVTTSSNLIVAYKTKKSYRNYFWSTENSINVKEYKSVSQNKTVYCFDLLGNLIDSYTSLTQAGIANDTSAERIKNAIGKQTTINKKYFSYNDRLILGLDLNRTIYRYSIDGNYLDSDTIGNYCAKFSLDAKKLHKASNAGLRLGTYQWNIINPIKMTDLTSHIGIGYKKKVGQYDINGNLIKIFDTVTECKKEFTNVRKVLNGQLPSTKGYIFKYIE
mgnify:CR=1 FL=1